MEPNLQPQTTYQSQPTHPGRVLSIIGLIFAFVFLGLPGLVLSIIGLIKSKHSGKIDVIAILGLIFNILSIVIGGGILAVLVLVAYSNIQEQARDTKRQADASSLIAVIEAYDQSKNQYPSSDPDTFRQDIAQVSQIESNPTLYNMVTDAAPTKSDPDRYNIALCGGDDETSATGMRVAYWNESTESIKMLTTGNGCSDPNASADDCSSTGTIQDGASCTQGSSDGESMFN